jgi:hypothetical protein
LKGAFVSRSSVIGIVLELHHGFPLDKEIA